VSALEWLVIIEVVLLVAMGLFSLAGAFIARSDPEDPIVIFCRTFWNTFLYPPMSVARKPGFDVRAKGKASSSSSSTSKPQRVRGKKAKEQDEDAVYGRVERGADGMIHTANLNVTVLPHSSTDDFLGRTSDGIELQVTGAAEDGASNKTVIQLVSKALGVKPYQVTLTKGHYQTRKSVSVTGIDQESLDSKLESMG
jgi:uncharacterized protein YggU (UPF0235/DUF167 family)